MFQALSSDDKDVILEFLLNLTEGDIRMMAKAMLMDRQDIRRLLDAFERLQSEDEIPT